MKKVDSRTRLFEVMSRLDKTFKIPKLNEGFEQMGGEETPEETPDLNSEETPEVEEKTVEEKYEELKAKVEELYALINGGDEETELPAEPEETDDAGLENLQEWNFDKKKDNKFEKKDKKETKSHEDAETEKEEEFEHTNKKELKENKPKIPVVPIAKVGK